MSLSAFESGFILLSTTEPEQNYIKVKILILRWKMIIMHVAFFWGMGMQIKGFPVASKNKESVCNRRHLVQSLGLEDPLENRMATHSSILVVSLVAQMVKNLLVMQATQV